MCFDFSNNLQDETTSPCGRRSILDWIGFSVDIASLKAFFSQDSLTVLAVWGSLTTLVYAFGHRAAFDVLLSVQLSITDQAPRKIGLQLVNLGLCMERIPDRLAMLLNTRSFKQRELDTALQHAIHARTRTELMKQLISAGASLQRNDHLTSVYELIRCFIRRGLQADDISLLETLLKAGAVVDHPFAYERRAPWQTPYEFIHATDYILLNWRPSTKSQDLFSLVSLYSDRQQTTVTVPGIFEAAQGGQEQLHSYLNSRLEPYDDQNKNQVLELALSEASGRGYANVAQSLVQYGVDPHVRMLPKSSTYGNGEKNIWHPLIRAVNNGKLDTLRILASVSSIDTAFLDEQFGAQVNLCALQSMTLCQRDSMLQILSQINFSNATRGEILLRAVKHYCCSQPGHADPDSVFVSQLLKLGLGSLETHEFLDRENPHILVDAIKRECSVPALKFLTRLVEQQGRTVSALSARTLGALARAALAHRHHRHDILDLLVPNVEGLQSYIQRTSLSLLSYFVKHGHSSFDSCMRHWENDCETTITLKWFLDLGAPLKGPVLAKLIQHASEDFILGMIRSIPEVNEENMCDALKWSILCRRLNLAVALIQKGAQVNCPRDEHTALQMACRTLAPLWFIELLVEKGADLDSPPRSFAGCTALQAACSIRAHLSCINFLVEKKADVNAPPALQEGYTAIQYAASRGLMNVAGLLLDHGADVNALSGFSSYETHRFGFERAIDLAVSWSRLDMVHFLAAAGARSSKPGLTGFDGAIEIATRKRNFAIARLLQEHADSCSKDPMDAEQVWLRANPRACMYEGRILPASWAAFVNRNGGGDSEEDFYKYRKEQLVHRLE